MGWFDKRPCKTPVPAQKAPTNLLPNAGGERGLARWRRTLRRPPSDLNDEDGWGIGLYLPHGIEPQGGVFETEPLQNRSPTA
jgi:hypothetical protein